MRRVLILLLASFVLTGCIPAGPSNPAISLTRAQAWAALDDMAARPASPRRPLVVLGGYRTLEWQADLVASRLARAIGAGPDDVLVVSFLWDGDLDAMTRSLVAAVREKWPQCEAGSTREIDVVGISMGGLLARWAALPPEERVRGSGASRTLDVPRLRVSRLFTLATPHRGARAASYLRLDDAVRDMRPASEFLQTLERHRADQAFPMICYAHAGDRTVGAANSAPPGMVPIWTQGTLLFSHFSIAHDPVILADIARRLRGDEPLLEVAGEPP